MEGVCRRCEKAVYTGRRKKVKELVKSGIILMPGNNESPMNYTGNPYHFRQDSTFLYFFGVDKPGFSGLIDVEGDKDYIYGTDFTVDDIIWMGPQPTVTELAAGAGITQTGEPGDMDEKIKEAIAKGRKIHYLPAYRAERVLQLEQLLGISTGMVKTYISEELIKAVVALRSLKTEEEVKQMETAVNISYEMYSAALKAAKVGAYEYEVMGKMEGVVSGHNSHISFPTILTINGETLHNHYHGNRMDGSKPLIIDSGAESPLHYASDITRTYPVGGTFTPEQKDIYAAVLKSQIAAIEAVKPGIYFKDIHLQTCKIIAEGLKEVGLMKGNIEDAVKEGAHALFFPHGLGHMIGLDVHDMEDLGENYVGYDDTLQRSDQFGLAYLRMARELKPGFVLTVEPGCYFIPALIDQWKDEKKHEDFINYEKVEQYKSFGGIRIEDDVLVTGSGYRVLGKPIPKTFDEIAEHLG